MSWNRLEQPCRCDSALVSAVVLELSGLRQLSSLEGVHMCCRLVLGLYHQQKEMLGDAMSDP